MIFYLATLAIAAFSPASELTINAGSTVSAAAVLPEDGPIKRGGAVGDSPRITIDSILSNPNAYTGKSVTVEGLVGAVCTRKGCWMEIAPKEDQKGVRVTFKDYGFFVPVDSKGMTVLAEGEVKVNLMSKDDVEHMESEGATVGNKNPDGTAAEITFVATGVELRK